MIEIIITISIIGILIAITLPVLNKTRETARKSTCMAHQRQIWAAVAMYAQDCDDTLPFWNAAFLSKPPLPENPDLLWKTQIQHYMANENPGSRGGKDEKFVEMEVWRCPNLRAWYDGLGKGTNWMKRRATASYGMNMYVAYDYFGASPLPPLTRYRPGLPLASLRSPSNTVLFGEAGMSGRIDTPIVRRWMTYQQLYKDAQVQNWERRDAHQGGANYTFCDGHSAWKSAEVMYPSSYEIAQRSARDYFAATEEDWGQLSKKIASNALSD